ncbi:MAG: hypothetical protein HKN21_06615 [Candidatus Eisenbacteria bacterium]|uniref:Uncharacterized protein n=1 Tax=Eiseniibacteriota bacterium TaxID=2212470 RepID=A0A7Y2E837_UNCEI|nr:hypothetical protein [Candidatus Eisenbacteria bacterium]
MHPTKRLDQRPPLETWQLVTEGLGGLAFEMGLALAGAGIASAFTVDSGGFGPNIEGAAIGGGIAVASIGAALGVYINGVDGDQGGSFLLTWMGSALGTAAGLGLLVADDDPGALTTIGAFTLPVLGSMLAFNASRYAKYDPSEFHKSPEWDQAPGTKELERLDFGPKETGPQLRLLATSF